MYNHCAIHRSSPRTKPQPAKLLLCILWALFLYEATGCSKKSEKETDNKSITQSALVAIEPRMAVGKVLAQMPVQTVIDVLGEPNSRTGHVLHYTSLGFSVIPDKSGIVKVVMCGDPSTFDSPLVRAFSGRTKEGIGMGSSRSDILKAFGNPTNSKQPSSDLEVLEYPQTGMTLTLDNNKVCHIIVHF